MTGSDPDEVTRAAAREVLRELVAGLLGDAPADPQSTGTNGGHATNGSATNGHARHRPAATRHEEAVVPQVPAPPVAAVLRPSTWSSPPAPGEVIGDAPPGPARDGAPTPPTAPAPDVRVEPVTIDTTEDLERFVQALAARLEQPRDRQAIRAGRLRFTLRRAAADPASTGATAGGPAGARAPTTAGGPAGARAPTTAGGPVRATATPATAARVVKGAVTERTVRDAAANGARLVLARGAVLTPLARDRARALGVEIERERTC